MTTFADQVNQFGGSPVGGMPYSWLKGPSGQILFVSPYRTASATSGIGNDGNPGTFNLPMKTVSAAYDKCITGKGNIIYVFGDANASADITDDLSATLTLSKDSTSIIGLTTPSIVSQRARIAQLSTATSVSPLINVTGNNSTFANLQIYQGVADAGSLIDVQVTGQRNFFHNVHFAGVADATMSATGCCSLKLNGAAENVFKGCVIGVDTATMDGDGANMIVDGDAVRNLFEDCLFQAFISSANAAHVRVADGTAIQRWLWFKRCQFMAQSLNRTVDMAEVFDVPAGMVQGAIVLQDCATLDDGGAPVWTAGTEGCIWANMPTATASAGGGLDTKL